MKEYSISGEYDDAAFLPSLLVTTCRQSHLPLAQYGKTLVAACADQVRLLKFKIFVELKMMLPAMTVALCMVAMAACTMCLAILVASGCWVTCGRSLDAFSLHLRIQGVFTGHPGFS